METIQIVVLAIVQGLTEFLPISSSGHLVLMPQLFGWGDQGLAFDVAVHVGTLLAVLAYFRHDLAEIIVDTFGSLFGKGQTTASRLGWAVVVATLPVGVVGVLFKALIETHLRGAMVVAAATVVFGLLLGWSDWRGQKTRSLTSLRWRDALVIGLAQALALIPGTSRSGITMTAGLMLGLTREAAARFSFLMAIPTIMLAGGLLMLDAFAQAEPFDWGSLLLGVGVSALTAYLCIHWFLSFIQRFSMQPFVIYRLFLGAIIVWWFW